MQCFWGSHRRLWSSAGRSNFISFLYFFTCASRTKLSFITWARYLHITVETTAHTFNLNRLILQTEDSNINLYRLVNGPKQPLWLFVEGHNHQMEMCQLDGDLRWEGRIWQLFCAHAGVLGNQTDRCYRYTVRSISIWSPCDFASSPT